MNIQIRIIPCVIFLLICFTVFRMTSTQAGQSAVVHRLATLLRNNGIESVFQFCYCLFLQFHQDQIQKKKKKMLRVQLIEWCRE